MATPKVTMSKRAGLIMPAKRIRDDFLGCYPTDNVTKAAGVALTAVAENLVAQLTQQAQLVAREDGRNVLREQDIMHAITRHEDLARLFQHTIIGRPSTLNQRRVAKYHVRVAAAAADAPAASSADASADAPADAADDEMDVDVEH